MVNKKSILQICKVYFPVKGGVQIVAERLARQLRDRYTSTILTTTEGEAGVEETDFGKVVRHKSWFELFSLPFAPALLSGVFKHSPGADYVLSHSPFPLADFALLLSFRRLRKLIVYWHSDVVSQRLLQLLLSPLTHLLLRRADAIAVSNPVLIETSRYLSRYRDKCTVVPIGFDPDPEAVEKIQDKGYFLFVGRHVPYKGISVLIDAVQQSGVKLVLAGGGPLYDKHREKIERLALTDRVSLVRNPSDPEVQVLMAECRAFVLPSVLPSEAFGMVQAEAMSFGKPVVNTWLASGVPWVARDGIEGITVEARDVVALAAALQTLNEDSGLRERLGSAARQRWEEEFSLRTMDEKMASLLQRLDSDRRCVE